MSGAIFMLTFLIIGGCNKDNNTAVNFTIDLTQPQFSALTGFGNSIVYNGICIARDASGNYVAVSAYCTVDNEVLTFSGSQNYFVCPLGHDFSEQGSCINDHGAPPLIVYHTNLVNNLLQIYS